MKKSLIFVLCVWCLGLRLNGQTITDNNPVIPPSPTAYNLGKVATMQTGLFTGTINNSIPLIEYKTPNLSVPITLTYSSTGIKVEDVESWTGLVWNLNAGGVITRKINGSPDVELRHSTNVIGYPEEVVDALVSEYTANGNLNATLQSYLLSAANTGGFNTEYDLFSFNFLNFSGKFIITSRGEVIQEAASDLDIKALGLAVDDGFIVTDDMGIQYKFLTTETTQVSFGPDSRVPPTVTSWYLSEIVHPKGDKIFFTYNQRNFAISFNGGQEYIKTQGVFSSPGSYVPSSIGFNQYLSQINSFSAKRLSKISSNFSGEVIFNSTITTVGQTKESLLNGLEYKNEKEDIIEKITLNYLSTLKDRTYLSEIKFNNPAKKILLNYYSPELFPARNSFSQDYWGYYNGKENLTLLPSHPDFLSLNTGFTQFADREPNGMVSHYGLLKEIKYPTGGKSLIEYEANDYSTNQNIDVINHINLEKESEATALTEESESLSIIPARDISVDIIATLSRSNSSECPGTTDPDIIRRMGGQFRIRDLTNDVDVIIYEQDNNSFTSSTLVTVTNGLGDRFYKVVLKAGNEYKLYVSAPYQCSKLFVSFSYPKTTTVSVYNKKTAGVRVKSIKNYASTVDFTSTYYKYSDNIQSEKSSGVMLTNPPQHFSLSQKEVYVEEVMSIPNPIPEILRLRNPYIEYALSSNSIDLIYNGRGDNIVYATVMESNSENNETGYVLHRFKTSLEGGGLQISGDNANHIANQARTNLAWDNGLEYYTGYYMKNNEGFILMKDKTITYFGEQVRSVPMIKVQKRYSPPCGGVFPPIQEPAFMTVFNACASKGRGFVATANDISKIYKYGICTTDHNHARYFDTENILRCSAVGSQNVDGGVNGFFYGGTANLTATLLNSIYPINSIYYHFNSYKFNIASEVDKDYSLSGNVLTVEKKYSYNLNNHIKKIEEKNSKGDIIQLEYFYPSDYPGVPIFNEMTSRKMSGVVVEKVVKNLITNTELKRDLYEFEYNAVQNHVLPKEIKSSVRNSTLKSEIQFKKYDVKGNILEVEKDGIIQSYLWGYKGRYLVGKVVGKDYNTIAQLIDQSVLNNNDDVYTNADIEIELNKIQQNLTAGDVQITLYLYKPLIGIVKEINPNGKSIYYEYDSFNRLHLIKDDEGKILKRVCYNYAGQVEDCGNESLYYNNVKSGTFTRNNCGTGFIGSNMTYTVPANTFSASSQVVADSLAQADVNANGQAYANTNGTCTATPPVGIYARLELDDFYEDIETAPGPWAYELLTQYANLYLRFYSDAACTVPFTLSSSLSYSFKHAYTTHARNGTVYNNGEYEMGTRTIQSGISSYLIGDFGWIFYRHLDYDEHDSNIVIGELLESNTFSISSVPASLTTFTPVPIITRYTKHPEYFYQ